MTRISVDLPDALAASLQQMSESRGTAPDEVVAEALALMADLLPDMERRVEEGRADIEAGRFVEHEQVVAWLRSWGTEDELPPPNATDLVPPCVGCVAGHTAGRRCHAAWRRAGHGGTHPRGRGPYRGVPKSRAPFGISGARLFVIARTPYLIRYDLRQKRLEILDICHGGRQWHGGSP